MRIYIDEDLASGLLIRLLQNAGHDIDFPSAAGRLGRSDAAQLTFAIQKSRVCLTANYDDWEDLRLLMVEGQGVYRLADEWYPVQKGDVIWMASYCPQWFVAMGKGPARYLYYKDVNRDPLR